MTQRRVGFGMALVLWVSWGMSLAAQVGERAEDLAAGKVLIAQPDMPDPRFAHTVILLVQHGGDGAMGLILNRQTKLPLSKVLDGLQGAKNIEDPAYLGGPVEMESVLVMMRSGEKLSGAKQVLPDVYLIASKAAVEKALLARPDPGRFRAYMGYAGWGPKQLEHEMDLEAWFILRGEAAMVFDPDPDTLWSRLIRKTKAQIARRRPNPRRELKTAVSFAKIGS